MLQRLLNNNWRELNFSVSPAQNSFYVLIVWINKCQNARGHRRARRHHSITWTYSGELIKVIFSSKKFAHTFQTEIQLPTVNMSIVNVDANGCRREIDIPPESENIWILFNFFIFRKQIGSERSNALWLEIIHRMWFFYPPSNASSARISDFRMNFILSNARDASCKRIDATPANERQRWKTAKMIRFTCHSDYFFFLLLLCSIFFPVWIQFVRRRWRFAWNHTTYISKKHVEIYIYVRV